MICNKKRQLQLFTDTPNTRSHITYPLEWTKTVLKKEIKGGKKSAIKNRYLELCHCFSLGVQSLELYHLQGRSIFYNV